MTTKAPDELRGHGFDRANVCAACRGPLAAQGRHYHTRTVRDRGYGAEPICCKCTGLNKCSSTSLEGKMPGKKQEALTTDDLKPYTPKDVKEIHAKAKTYAKAHDGKFTVAALWKELGGPDAVWYKIREVLRGEPELFAQSSRNTWELTNSAAPSAPSGAGKTAKGAGKRKKESTVPEMEEA